MIRFIQSVALAIVILCAGVHVAPAQAQAVVATPATVALPEATNYVQAASPFLAYGQYLQCAAVVEKIGPDCGGRIFVDPKSFPNNTVIAWNVPLRATATTKPWAYPAVSRGRPSGGAPKVIDPIKRLGDIKALPISWNIELKVVGDASPLNDTFLFSDDTLKSDKRVLELGVFAYAGPAARAFINASQPIRTGKFTDPTGRVWLARRANTYMMFVPETGDALVFDGDLKWFFDFLMGAGLATADMRYAGTALGVEPGQGAGLARIVKFDVGPG